MEPTLLDDERKLTPRWSRSDVSKLVLRAGLGTVFVVFGVDKIIHPGHWIMFVPTSLGRSIAAVPWLSVNAVLRVQGVAEAVLAVLVIAGLAARVASVALTALLIAIVIDVGFTPIGLRDVGLLGAALMLAIDGSGLFSLDAILARRRAKASEAAWRVPHWGTHLAWIGVICLLVALLAGRGTGTRHLEPALEPAAASIDGKLLSLSIPPIPVSIGVDPGRARLGNKLFHDPRLSRDGMIACSSCHDLAKGGVDGRKVSIGIGGAIGDVNAPTVLNAALNFKQFWDGRADTLEAQAAGPILNPKEMGSSWIDVLSRLRADPEYASLFRSAFSDGITQENVTVAIAEFERTLLTPDSPFDRYLRGDTTALTPEQQEGYGLFSSLGCISCHQGANMGGNIFQTMGKVEDYFAGREVRPPDFGRYNVTHDERDKFKFKVPSLRNVARTAPYFHDGSAATLEDAVTVMARYQLGYVLTADETRRLVAFLQTLDGRSPEL